MRNIKLRNSRKFSWTRGKNIISRIERREVKAKKEFEDKAKQRIKVGLILNEYSEQNKIKVEENEMQIEIQKQLRMMPGQENF